MKIGDTADYKSALRQTLRRNADFQSAVSQVCNLLTSPNYDYGWLKVSYNPVEGAALSSVAFNTTPNEDINAGQMSAVPEPSEWAALSFGVLGVVWVAKRRFMPARV